mgnify:CR=1 FL=1
MLPFLAGIASTSADTLTYHAPPKPLPPQAVTADWPGFLGPQRNSICRETRLLKIWPRSGPSLVWELKKGRGYSAPAVVGNKLVFFHRVEDQERVICLESETGRHLWQYEYTTNYRDRFGYSNGPRATPLVDAQYVYTLGAEGKLYCLNLHTGEKIWNRDLFSQYKLKQEFFGIASTPLIEGDYLIINVGAPGGPCVVALNKHTGDPVWQSGREWGASYASPVAAQVHGERRLFVFTGGATNPPTGGLLCINPRNGLINWRFPWRSSSYESVNAACPVVFDNRVFISASYHTGSMLLGVKEDFSHQKLWTTKQLGTHFSTAIYKDGYLYGFDGRNEPDAALVCLDAKSGKQMWRLKAEWEEKYEYYGQQRQARYGPYRGALLMADGHFLCLGELGHLLWLDLSPTGHQILARTWLFAASQSWTPPVVSHGLLYVVQNDHDRINDQPPRLLCYDLRDHVEN